MSEPRATSESIDEIVFRDLLADGVNVRRCPTPADLAPSDTNQSGTNGMPDWIRRRLLPPAEFERMLRDRYEPLVSAEDYARLREMCGVGPVIDGEIVVSRPAIEAAPDA